MIARCCECGATFNRDRDEARKVNYTTREEWLVAAMRTLDDWRLNAAATRYRRM